MSVRADAVGCLREDTLLAMLDGRLAPAELGAVEEHLSGCEACLRLLAVSTDPTESGAHTPEVEKRAPAAAALDSDDRISRYRVTGPIGAGGVGIVYSAWDPELSRPVALKLLRAELSARSDGKSRVLREAQAMARLKHPNVVAIYDVGTWRQQVFIAMELVEGGTLRKWQTASPRTWRELLRVYLGAGRGLAAAHAVGLVHRDFKPDNVLVAPDGRVLVTDFGMARLEEGELELAASAPVSASLGHTAPQISEALTPLGALVGTPAYMSPEQLRGAGADARSDLFSYCTALYEALAGTRPYPGDTLAALRARAESGVLEPAKKKLPRWLMRELSRGLRPEPLQRHASIDELLSALERGAFPSRARRLAKRGAIALALVALAFVGADRSGLLLRLRRLTPSERRAAGLLAHADDELRLHGRAAGADALRSADKAVPGNPRILTKLGDVLLDLGASAEANEVVARAFLRQDELPPDERAELEILRFRTLRQDDQAIARARAFWQEAPGDLGRGLLVARELGLSSKFAEELAVIDQLHRLPPPAGTDPQLDLREAQAAHSSGDLPRALAAARRAYSGFAARNDRLDMARARQREGLTLQRLGKDPALARRALEDSIALSRSVQDTAGIAAPEITLAAMMVGSGDLAGARAVLEDALAICRQSGNRSTEGIALINLASLVRRQRDLPAAIERATEAQTLFLELGDPRRRSIALTLIGDVREELGDLTGSASALEQVLAFQREVKDPLGLFDAFTGLIQVRLEQGDLAAARKLLDEARANAGKASKRSTVDLFWLEAALDFAEEKYSDAAIAAGSASKSAADAGLTDEEAEAEALLARSLIELGRLGEARAAVTKAQALLANSKSGVARGELAVADGRLLAKEDPSHPARAQAALDAALAQAMQNGVAVNQWEARLAVAEVHAANSSKSAGRASLEQLAGQARAQGFGLYVLYAEGALRKTPLE